MFRRVSFAALAIGAAAALPAEAAEPTQVVSSDGGLLASAGIWSQDMVLADGSSLDFNVLLAVPEGAVTATPPSSTVDFSRPWVHVDVWKHDNVNHAVDQVCSHVANPGRWSAGALNPKHAFTDSYGGTSTTTYAAAWEGVEVDVRCDDGAGYDFYRVTWALDRSSWLTTNSVAVHWAVAPARTFGAENAAGTVTLSATAVSTHPVRVCGHRAGGAVDCFSGHGQVVPQLGSLATTATALSP